MVLAMCFGAGMYFCPGGKTVQYGHTENKHRTLIPTRLHTKSSRMGKQKRRMPCSIQANETEHKKYAAHTCIFWFAQQAIHRESMGLRDWCSGRNDVFLQRRQCEAGKTESRVFFFSCFNFGNNCDRRAVQYQLPAIQTPLSPSALVEGSFAEIFPINFADFLFPVIDIKVLRVKLVAREQASCACEIFFSVRVDVKLCYFAVNWADDFVSVSQFIER